MLPENVEVNLHKNFIEICKSLNLEKHAAGEAWKTFLSVYDPFFLEGDPLHWSACALFITCRKSVSPGSTKPGIIPGSQINLGKLLRIIYLSVADFFIKIKKWADIVQLSPDFHVYLEMMERNFTVSTVLYQKFKPIFFDMFTASAGETRKTKKLKSLPPQLGRVFDFTWLLFVTVKSNFPDFSDDLVSSYHLLLSCCDFIYINAVMSGREDINPNFPELAKPNGKIVSLSGVPCVIDQLCHRHDGIALEAKSVKEYSWRRIVKKLFERKILKGNQDLLLDVLSSYYFEHNINYLRRTYHEFLTANGVFDESILLDVPSEPASPSHPLPAFKYTDIGVQLEAKRKFNSQVYRGCLSPPQDTKMVQNSVKINLNGECNTSVCIAALLSLVSDTSASPSRLVSDILSDSSCLEKTIDKLVKKLECEAKKSCKEKIPSVLKELELVVKLFYKLLDTIIKVESKKPNFDPMMLLKSAIVSCLFACSAEIVIFSYKIDLIFPWVLNALEIAPYHFYRIIEIVVREEELIPRDIVKHLNFIEESILERLAWELKSPLWRSLINSSEPIPTCESVTIHCISFEAKKADSMSSDQASSQTGDEGLAETPTQHSSIADKFMSPQKRNYNETVSVTLERGEPPKKIMAIVGARVVEPHNDDGSATTVNVEKIVPVENGKEKRSGSVALFFRKFYLLACIRLQDLCDQLKLTDVDVRFKIWTCFEYTLTNHVGLMVDRHVDQLLMCSIHVICKVSGIDKTFMEMMGCYRNQPQARSYVYRKVLISPVRTLEDLKENYDGILTSNDKEVRSDIIQFYNNVYISKVKKVLAQRFRKNGSESERSALSPLPVVRNVPSNTHRRISEKYAIFLRTASSDKIGISPTVRPLSYCFSRSPAKDLQAINSMLSMSRIRSKNQRTNADAKSSMGMAQKVQNVCMDRAAVNK